MWACSVSEFVRRTRAVLAVLALVVAFAGTSEARVRVKVDADSIASGSRVTVGPAGVVVTRAGSGSQVSIGSDADSFGAGAIVVDEGSGIVRFLSDAEVKAGERVDGDVVALAGNVRVAGEVSGAVVAVLGSISLEKGAKVDGDAVSVLGGLRSAGEVTGSAVSVLGGFRLIDSARVGGDAVCVGGTVEDSDSSSVAGQVVSLGFLPLTLGMPVLTTVLAFIALGWVLSIFFGWIFAALFPGRLARVGITSSRRTLMSIVVALVAGLCWPVAAILLISTIIGAPIGILLFVLVPVAQYAGQLAGTYVLGSKLLRRRLGEGAALGPIVAGTSLIALFFVAGALLWMKPGLSTAIAVFLFLLGILLQIGLSTIGTGALLLSRFGSRPHDLPGDPVAPTEG